VDSAPIRVKSFKFQFLMNISKTLYFYGSVICIIHLAHASYISWFHVILCCMNTAGSPVSGPTHDSALICFYIYVGNTKAVFDGHSKAVPECHIQTSCVFLPSSQTPFAQDMRRLK